MDKTMNLMEYLCSNYSIVNQTCFEGQGGTFIIRLCDICNIYSVLISRPTGQWSEPVTSFMM